MDVSSFLRSNFTIRNTGEHSPPTNTLQTGTPSCQGENCTNNQPYLGTGARYEASYIVQTQEVVHTLSTGIQIGDLE